MGKRIYNDWTTSVYALLGGLVGVILGGLLVCLVLVNAVNVFSKVFWSLMLMPFIIGGAYCIILSFVKGFDYWFIVENTIHYKKPFREEVVIKFDNIESVEHTTIKSLGSSKYSLEDVYIIHSKNKNIIIYTEEDRRKSCKQILIDTKKMLSKYLIE